MPLLGGRPPAYDALCSHLDIVVLPPGGVALAANALAPVQAAEIAHDGGTVLGRAISPGVRFRRGRRDHRAARGEPRARGAGRGRSAEALAYARDLRGLDERPQAAWRLGLSEAVLTPQSRALELANFIAARVRPAKSARGRA